MIFRLFALLLGVSTLSGCEYARVAWFQAADSSGTPGKTQLSVYLLGPIPTEPGDPQAEVTKTREELSQQLSTLKYRDELTARLEKACPAARDQNEVAPVAPFAAAIAGVAIDIIAQSVGGVLQSRVDEFVQKSKRQHLAELLIERPSGFATQKQCLVLVRSHATKTGDRETWEPTLVVALAIEPYGADSAARLYPIYLHLEKAAVITARDKGVSIAVAIGGAMAWVKERDGPTVVSYPPTPLEFAFKGVNIGQTIPFTGAVNSELIAVPPQGARAIDLRIALTETGSGLPDAERAKAEAKAAASTIGRAQIRDREAAVAIADAPALLALPSAAASH